MLNRRRFIGLGVGTCLGPYFAAGADGERSPLTLPEAHREILRQRRKRIVVQQDVHWVMANYAKLHPEGTAPFAPFRDAVFSFVDEPGSQIDAIWWDIGGSAVGNAYPSQFSTVPPPPLAKRWADAGLDWVAELVKETRRRKLEVFWNHRISEVEIKPEGGTSKEPDPLKVQHPDWVAPATWWPQGMWNLASEGLREHKVGVLRELATRYNFDGMQIDFSRHVPCLPVGRQWELRGEVTRFMRMVRRMLLEVAAQRGRPLLLAAKVPQNPKGCHMDGFDVNAWAEQNLVDVLTLGSRTMDVDVEGMRALVGRGVQLQPCFDDHHATDGYRYVPLDYLRGIFANHWQRGADSVVTFNWAVAPPEVAKKVGGEIAPPTHEAAFKEVGDPRSMAGKDKSFAVERRGGYPWAEGYFNRNDDAPLPARFPSGSPSQKFILHLSDAPTAKAELILRCVWFQTQTGDEFVTRLNGVSLALKEGDAAWKDPQIFSPKPQPPSGGKGEYKANPQQRLSRLDHVVPAGVWRQGANEVEITVTSQAAEAALAPQLEKLEGLLHYL